jgi:MFS family permease
MAMLVAAVSAAMFVDSLLYSVVVPVLPSFAHRLGSGPAGISLLYAAYAGALLAATPLLGRFGDWWGHRGPFLAGTVGVALSTLAFAVAQTYPELVGARALQGLAAAAVWTSGVAMVAGRADNRRVGTALGTVMACMSAGMILGPPLGGLLLAYVGGQAPFLACAVVAALVAALLPFAVRGGPIRQGSPTTASRLLRDPAMLPTLVAVACGAGGLSLLEPLLPLDLAGRLGAGPAAVGLVFGAATLANGIASPAAGAIADRWPSSPLAGMGLVGMGLLAPVLAWAGNLASVAIVLVAFAVAYSFVLIVAMSRLARVAQRGATGGRAAGYGTVYAAFNIAYAAGMVAGPLAGGAGVEVAGTPAAFGLCGVLLLLSGGVLLARHLRHRLRPRQLHAIA